MSRLPVLLLLGCCLVPGRLARAQEQVLARRLNDTVVIRRAADRSERVLYSFDPTVDLLAGDEIEQGSGGQSTVLLSTGGLVEMFSSGHLILEQLSEQGDVLRFPMITRVKLVAAARPLLCWLPGGSSCRFQDATISVRGEPGRMIVRSERGGPVQLTGTLTLEPGMPGGSGSTLELVPGQEVHLPLFRVGAPALGSQWLAWNGRALRHSGGFELTPGEQGLLVRPAAAGGFDVLTVGGVRVVLGAGQELLLQGEPRGALDGSIAPPDEVPPGLTPVSEEAYFQARQAGLTDEQIAEKGYWVPPEIATRYAEWASRHQAAGTEEAHDPSNNQTEDSSP